MRDTSKLKLKYNIAMAAYRGKLRERFCHPVTREGQYMLATYVVGDDKLGMKKVRGDGSELPPDVFANHFDRKVTKSHFGRNGVGPHYEGAVSVRASFPDGHCKFFCLDVDHQDAHDEVLEKFVPLLERLGIEYFYEFRDRGNETYKGHYWFFLDAKLEVVKDLTKRLIYYSDLANWRNLNLEWFPAYKPNNTIKMPAGAQMKFLIRDDDGNLRQEEPTDEELKDLAYPIRFKGKVYKEKFETAKMLSRVKVYSEEELKEIIASLPLEDTDEESGLIGGFDTADKGEAIEMLTIDPGFQVSNKESDFINVYRYKPSIKLPLPEAVEAMDVGGEMIEIDPFLRTLGTQCPAYHELMRRTAEEQWLEDSGGTIHDAGLCTVGMFKYTNEKVRKNEQDSGSKIEQFKEAYMEEFRLRPAEKHGWDKAAAAIWKCETMEDKFGKCEGCPHQGKITNPASLHFAEKIKYSIGSKVHKTGSINKIKNESQTPLFEEITHSLDEDLPLNAALITPTGTKKSLGIDQMMKKLSELGRSTVLAVPTAAVGREHVLRLRKMGVATLPAFSFDKLFENMDLVDPDFKEECPNHAKISRLLKQGISGTYVKNRYCKKCPFKDECPYPSQYKKIAESGSEYPVVVIQHAHLKSADAMRQILKRQFDCLFLDEYFVNSLKTFFRLSGVEKVIMRNLIKDKDIDISWLKDLFKWMRGKGSVGYNLPVINFKPKELFILKKAFADCGKEEMVQEYLRAYNSGHVCKGRRGVFQYHALPDSLQIPICVLTDATLPIDLINAVTGRKFISYGGDRYVDPTFYNPNNRVIKIVDNSPSVSRMLNPNYLLKWLIYIGHMAQTQWKDYTILVTVYAKQEKVVRQFFDRFYPGESARISISHMEKGINTWASINVQVLLARVFYNAEAFYTELYEITQMMNHWRIVNHQPALPSTHPNLYFSHNEATDDGDGNMIEMHTLSEDHFKEVPVSFMIKCDDGNTKTITFPKIMTREMHYTAERLVEKIQLGASEQANRLRIFDKNVKILVDADNRKRSKIVYTEYKFLSEIFNLDQDGQEEVEIW